MADNIYFQGFICNKKKKAREVIDALISDILINNYINLLPTNDNEDYGNNISILNNYKGVYFKTDIFNDLDVMNIYRNINFFNDKYKRKNIYTYHFFYTEENSEIYSYIELYKYISNIENTIRLLISLVYCLCPNLPYVRNKDTFIIANDISNYYNTFLQLEIKKIDVNSIFASNELYKINELKPKIDKGISNINTQINNTYKEYDNNIHEIFKFIRKISYDKVYLKNIRGSIAHNKMTFGYKNYRTIDYEQDLPFIKKIYKEINDFFINQLKIFKCN